MLITSKTFAIDFKCSETNIHNSILGFKLSRLPCHFRWPFPAVASWRIQVVLASFGTHICPSDQHRRSQMVQSYHRCRVWEDTSRSIEATAYRVFPQTFRLCVTAQGNFGRVAFGRTHTNQDEHETWQQSNVGYLSSVQQPLCEPKTTEYL